MDSPDTRTDVTYLGDGAYAGLEDGVIVIYTSDGMHTVVYENEAEWRNEEWREQADVDQAKEGP